MSHTAQLFCPADDYGCLTIGHVFIGTKDGKPFKFGRTDIGCANISELTCELLEDDQAQNIRTIFGAERKPAPLAMFQVTITAKNASDAIPYLSYASVRKSQPEAETQMENMRAHIRGAKEIAFQLHIGTNSETDALRLVDMCRATEIYKHRDIYQDPMARFFMHAPRAKKMFISEVIPDIKSCQALQHVARWASPHQQLVHQMCGALFNLREENAKVKSLPTKSFDAFAIRMPNVANNEKFLLFVDPGSEGVFLPKEGETCKVRSDAFKFAVKELDATERQQEVTETAVALLKLFKEASDTANPLASIRKLAPQIAKLSDEAVLDLFPERRRHDRIRTGISEPIPQLVPRRAASEPFYRRQC